MIEARFFKNKNNIYRGFQIEGHANYAPAGFDIVCAAVSALTQGTVIGLEKVQKLDIVNYTIQENERNIMYCCVRPAQASKAQVLLITLNKTLKYIEEEYKEYLRVTEVED